VGWRERAREEGKSRSEVNDFIAVLLVDEMDRHMLMTIELNDGIIMHASMGRE